VQTGPTTAPATADHGLLRRRTAHLYGLIVSGAVLAAAPDDIRLVRVSAALLGTLLVYWAAETYVHWIAARTLLQRPLHTAEERAVLRDGWPLVAASGVPLLVLLAEAMLDVPTRTAVNVALAINALLLVMVGWRMGRAGGLRGVRLVVSGTTAGLLGVAMIVLKTALH
jgi:hypothetical protein